jgi:sugar/nucleoside kinase (ribokinase family)
LIKRAFQFDFLIAVINSGRDFTFQDWRKIVSAVQAPIWLDVHSLPLAFVLKRLRSYRPLTRWRDWVEGIAYLQANEKEVASMLGDPSVLPSLSRIKHFGQEALELGLKAVFVTLGRRGVLVMAPGVYRILNPPAVLGIVDTTGCGDVFCAAAAARLAAGADPVKAALSGIRFASPAAGVAGVEETYMLVRSSQL